MIGPKQQAGTRDLCCHRAPRLGSVGNLVFLGTIFFAPLAISQSPIPDIRPFEGNWAASKSEEEHPAEAAKFVNFLRSDPKLELGVLEGLPNALEERDLFAREIFRDNILNRDGFFFYFERLKISNQDAAKIIQLFAQGADSAFGIVSGVKGCGGFHPDYLLSFYDSKGESYSAMVCYGCGEIVISTGRRSIRMDLISKEFRDNLKQILSEYRRNRPVHR